MQTKQARVFASSEVQFHGFSGQYWTWMPHQGLPEVESGKELVVLFPCDCGCWGWKQQASAMALILGNKNPERFVLLKGDERYHVKEYPVSGTEDTQWYVIER